MLPRDILYPNYLADIKAPRLSSVISAGRNGDLFWDGTLGGRFGLLRYTDDDPLWRRGWQLDFEGAAFVRLDFNEHNDVRSSDYRVSIPLTFSFGQAQTRVGYYHLSSHLGDEFLLKNPAFNRLNYSKDVLFLGSAYWLTRSTRVYGEVGWAFVKEIAGDIEFKFGLESAPRIPTGRRGAPFFAIGCQLQDEVDYGGGITVEAGWAWNAWQHTGLLRTGIHYYNGKSHQFSFFNEHEEQIGWGLWYDF
jgi:hypothetical protein